MATGEGCVKRPLTRQSGVGLPEEVMFEHTPEWRELCGQMEEESCRQRAQPVRRPLGRKRLSEAGAAGIEVRQRCGARARSYRDHEARISGLSLILLEAEFSRSHLPASQVSHRLQQ